MSAQRQTAAQLAGQVRPDKPQPGLTDAIAACACNEGVRAGLFLLNGDWERAHQVAQSMDDALGAHWHALVHRHEPDYPNSKYWLRQAGKSPVYARLVEAAQAAGKGEQVAPGGKWDALRFTDCFADDRKAAWTHPLDALEQRALLEHCLALPT